MRGESHEMCLLFDFYGGLLSERQQEIYDLYINHDFSLAEISEHFVSLHPVMKKTDAPNITRQGVRDAILRAESAMKKAEARLGLVSRYTSLFAACEHIVDEVKNIADINERRVRSTDIAAAVDRVTGIWDGQLAAQ